MEVTDMETLLHQIINQAYDDLAAYDRDVPFSKQGDVTEAIFAGVIDFLEQAGVDLTKVVQVSHSVEAGTGVTSTDYSVLDQ